MTNYSFRYLWMQNADILLITYVTLSVSLQVDTCTRDQFPGHKLY